MSDYNGKYVKIEGSDTMWAIDNDEREKLVDLDDMHRRGLRSVVTISEKELLTIPLKGKAKKNKEK